MRWRCRGARPDPTRTSRVRGEADRRPCACATTTPGCTSASRPRGEVAARSSTGSRRSGSRRSAPSRMAGRRRPISPARTPPAVAGRCSRASGRQHGPGRDRRAVRPRAPARLRACRERAAEAGGRPGASGSTSTGQDWAALATSISPTRRPSPGAVREMLAHLGLSEDLVEPPDEGPRAERGRRGRSSRRRARTRRRGEGASEDRSSRARAQAERGQRRRERPGRGDGRGPPRSEAKAPADDQDDAARSPLQPAAVHPARRRGARLPGVHDPVRRGGRGRGAVRAQRARPPARPARPVAGPLPGHDRPHGQPAAAQADGAAAALLVVRPRRGHARHRAPVPGRGQPRAPRSRTSSRRRPSSATPWSRC